MSENLPENTPPAYTAPAAPAAPGYGAAPAPESKGLALSSMIVGIVSLVLAWPISIVGIIGGIVALILGIIGRSAVSRRA